MPLDRLYCDVSDVGRLLGMEITETSSPSSAQVKEFISEAMMYIEKETGHAWREVRSEREEHEIGRMGRRLSWFSFTGYPIYLWHRHVRPIDTSKGDSFEVLEGEEWRDWSEKFKTGEVWLDEVHGIVYFRSIYGMKGYRLRITYRYGEDTVPYDIRLATAMLAASYIASSADKWNIVAEGATGVLTLPAKVEFWTGEARRIIAAHKEVRVP